METARCSLNDRACVDRARRVVAAWIIMAVAHISADSAYCGGNAEFSDGTCEGKLWWNVWGMVRIAVPMVRDLPFLWWQMQQAIMLSIWISPR